MATFTASGNVTSWANNTSLIATTSAPSAFNLNVSSSNQTPVTPFSASAVSSITYLTGLRQWSGTITTRIVPATLGDRGIVTFATGYATNLLSHSGRIAWEVKDATHKSGSGVSWLSHIPGLYSWSGDWSCNADDTAGTVLPSVTSASATFVIANPGGDNATSISGNIHATQVGITNSVGEIPVLSYSYMGDGNATILDPNTIAQITDAITTAGVVLTPAVGELVLTDDNNVYTGDAFLSSISWESPTNGPVTIELGFQGTGALAVT